MHEIKESDWKTFRQLNDVALERFCERILSEIERINADSEKSFHERYVDIYQVTRRRDKELASLFNGVGRSSAFMHLAGMRFRGLVTDDEFLQFSQEAQNVVIGMLERK